MTFFQRTIKRISLEQYVAENCVWCIYACRVCNATVSIGFSCKCKLFVVFFDLNNNNQEKTNKHVELNCAIFLWSIFFISKHTTDGNDQFRALPGGKAYCDHRRWIHSNCVSNSKLEKAIEQSDATHAW